MQRLSIAYTDKVNINDYLDGGSTPDAGVTYSVVGAYSRYGSVDATTGVFTPAGIEGAAIVEAVRNDNGLVDELFIVVITSPAQYSYDNQKVAGTAKVGDAGDRSSTLTDSTAPDLTAPTLGAYDPATGTLPVALSFPQDLETGIKSATITILVDGTPLTNFDSKDLIATLTGFHLSIPRGASSKTVEIQVTGVNGKGLSTTQSATATVPALS